MNLQRRRCRTQSFGPKLRQQNGEAALVTAIVLGVGALIVGGYLLIGWAADFFARKIPDSLEANLFSTLPAQQENWQSSSQRQALAIFKRLKSQKGLRQLDYRLFFHNQDEPNAFAYPGGSIAVTDGLLKFVDHDIGLAMVLAHEFGHHQNRHSLENMGRQLLFSTVFILVFGSDLSFLANAAFNHADNSHTQAQEREADAYGLNMIYQTYKTTDGALEFFKKLEQNPSTKSHRWASMLSTHPYTPDRIEHLKRLAEQLKAIREP